MELIVKLFMGNLFILKICYTKIMYYSVKKKKLCIRSNCLGFSDKELLPRTYLENAEFDSPGETTLGQYA